MCTLKHCQAFMPPATECVTIVATMFFEKIMLKKDSSTQPDVRSPGLVSLKDSGPRAASGLSVHPEYPLWPFSHP